MLKRFTTVLLCMSLVFGLSINVVAEEPVSPNPNLIEGAESDEEPEEEDISAFCITPPGEGQSGSNVVKVYDGFVTLTDQQLVAVTAEYGDDVCKKRKEEIALCIKNLGLGSIIETLDIEKPKFEGISFENYEKGRVYGVGDVIKIKIKASDNVEISSIKLDFRADTNSTGGKTGHIYNCHTTYNTGTDTWDYDFQMTEDMYPGEWYINEINIYDTSSNNSYVSSSYWDEDTNQVVKLWDFSVNLNYEHAVLDIEKPKFEGISFENYEKGRVYGVGDVIKIKIKASDNVEISSIKLDFRADTNSTGGKTGHIYNCHTTYNTGTDTWDYDFQMTEDMYPGEWYINEINIYDTSSNNSYVSSSYWDEDTNQVVKLWDFSVFFSNNGVFILPTYTVKFVYYAGSPTYTYTVLKEEKVEKYSAATPPENVPEFNGRKFIGWDGDYTNITSNRNIYAKFDSEILEPYMIVCADGAFLFTPEQYNYIKGLWSYTGDWKSVAMRHTRNELLKVCEIEGHIPTIPEPTNKPTGGSDVSSDDDSNNRDTMTDSLTNAFINTTIAPITLFFPESGTNGAPILVEKKQLTSDAGDNIANVLLTNENENKQVALVDDKNKIDNSKQIIQAPDSKLESKNIDSDKKADIVSEIKQSIPGSKVTVNMQSATIIPKEILQEVKGKDIDIVLDMGGYSWVINGKDVSASDLKDIDLEVTFDKDVIPNKTVKQLAGNNPVKKVSLTYNGSFGFTAKLKINLGSENVGKYGNLYYYDSDGYMRYQNAGLIREDGTVELVFSHASEYVVVISDEDMKSVKIPGVILTETGHNSNIKWYMIAVCVLLLGAGGVMVKRKKEEKDLMDLSK